MSKVFTKLIDKLVSNDKDLRMRFPINRHQEGTMQTHTNLEKEVLFQKLGSTWYVFTETNDEVVYSALPDGMSPKTTKLELFEVIEEHMEKVADHYRRSPEAAA